MKRFKFVFGLLLILIRLTSCSKSPDVPPGTPACIQDKIELRKGPCLDIVYKYKYKGEVVYYFSFNCPDFYHELYNKNCQFLCHPSGGFTGNGDGNCKDFYTEATNEEVIWQR